MSSTMSTTLTNAEYRKVNAWSKSDLDLISKGSANYEWARNCPSPGSAATVFGTCLHDLVLEPYKTSEAFLELTDANKEMATAMRDSVFAHPTAKHLLDLPGESECSVFSEINGIRVKCRPDRLTNDAKIIIDLKTTDDINKIKYSIIDYRYDVQSAFYSDIVEALSGITPEFVFIFVAKKRQLGRHPVEIVKLSPATIAKAREKYLKDLESARVYGEFGCGLEIKTLDL